MVPGIHEAFISGDIKLLVALGAGFGIGNTVQANSVADALHGTYKIPEMEERTSFHRGETKNLIHFFVSHVILSLAMPC